MNNYESNTQINSNNNNNNSLDANNNLLFKESSSKAANDKNKFSQDKCLYQSYFYSNKNTILNVFVMSYEEQLQKAITKGNLELSNELIQLGCNLNLQKNRRLPLGIACEYNYYDISELLLKNGAGVNKFDFFDQTALFYAINSADLDIIKLLIHHGASTNLCDSNGINPLHVAICRKNDEICEYLIAHGSDINAIDKQGSTALSLAISNDYITMINRLLDLGADPNYADKNGDTPLIKAIWSTMTSIIEYDQVFNVIKKLVELGCDIDAVNDSGRSALYTAVYQNNTEIALFLINQNAKFELEDNVIMGNYTLLHYACFQGNLVLVRTLLERNFNVNSAADYNETPIHIATTKGYLDIIDILIEYGANVNVFTGDENDNKCTPLQAAIYYISDLYLFQNIVDKLIMGGANLKIDKPGPLLILCLQYDKYNFAKYLVSTGADIEQRTIFNQSCFYKAFLSKNLEFMEMLILAGYNMYKDVWIGDYIENPDFIDFPEYFLNNQENSNNPTNGDNNAISSFLDEEEYFNRRLRSRTPLVPVNRELIRKIYSLLKYSFTNPLSLQELSRIAIRKHLLSLDYKIKTRIESLFYPNRLKNYLLFNEFIDI